MQSKAATVSEYLASLPVERKAAMSALRREINKNLPKGFAETMSYGMIGYVIPHSVYPAGYHCAPKLPLPFINIASQKNFIAVYHMGIYTNKKLLEWFMKKYLKHSPTKPDMGKGCLRFEKPELIPFKLIGELARKISAKEWIAIYEKAIKR